MPEKRRFGLRDELSASLEGLDDLAAELSSAPVDEDEQTAPLDEEAEPGLADLDPDVEAALAEVRELADEIAGPVDAEERPIRHIGIEARETFDAATLLATRDEEIDLDAEAAETAAVDDDTSVGEIEVTRFEVTSAAEAAEAAAARETAAESETQPETESEAEAEPESHAAGEPPAEDWSFEAVAPPAPPEAVVAEPAPAVSATTEAEAATPSAAEPPLDDDAAVAAVALPETSTQVTEAVMPAASAATAQETAPVRPWTPEAAMEPIHPLAPPPARPLAPTLSEIATPKLPADGGKKMNILPVAMIVIFAATVVALVIVLIHASHG